MAGRRSVGENAVDQLVEQALSAVNRARSQTGEIAERLRAEYECHRSSLAQLEEARPELSALFARSTDKLGAAIEQVRQMADEAEGSLSSLQRSFGEVAGHWESMKARHKIGERVIKAQEEERRRVAREIHDGPAQAMANVVLRTEICERLLKAGRTEVHQELDQLKMLVKGTLRELRQIIFDLRPMALDDLGLVPTLNRYLENLRQHHGVPVSLGVSGPECRLDPTHEVAIFRVVQESVNNARRHAQASCIQVQIEFAADDNVAIIIEDDGVGFDMEELTAEWINRESFGLMGMKERIELLDGEMNVTSVPGKGTRIVATLPL